MALLGKIGSFMGKGKTLQALSPGKPIAALTAAAESNPGSAAGQMLALGKLIHGFSGSGSPSSTQPEVTGERDKYGNPNLGLDTRMGSSQPSFQAPEYGAFQRRLNRISLRGGM